MNGIEYTNVQGVQGQDYFRGLRQDKELLSKQSLKKPKLRGQKKSKAVS